MHLQFVPSHVGIPGNERSDRRADDSEEAPEAVQRRIAVPQSTVKARVQRTFRRLWLGSTDDRHPHAELILTGASSLTDSSGRPRMGV